jgi:hypothetical protein
MAQYQSQPISQWQLGPAIYTTNIFNSTDTTDLTQSSAGSTYKYTMAQLLEFIQTTIGQFIWVDVTTPTVTLQAAHGYVCDAGGSLITFTLPATSLLGDTIRIAGYAAGLFTITQPSGQSIIFGDVQSTFGLGGSISSEKPGDFIEFVCVVPNTTWQVISAIGNFTIF